ncbi:MbtH family protein [Rhizohabitans arisaemae]|uniref:MbtH family protein n=1 Tax=Rhizohabitans arisaemae TaxID=2720610 RepID=UPI0024B1A27C|nr:MbtH family NRPS accessory protein [Rhizohabitans arisaemae]
MLIENEDPCKVVVNHEEQYSIWPQARENPPGWHDAGKEGTKGECLSWIDEHWTDMRPLSLRRFQESAERAAAK